MRGRRWCQAHPPQVPLAAGATGPLLGPYRTSTFIHVICSFTRDAKKGLPPNALLLSHLHWSLSIWYVALYETC